MIISESIFNTHILTFDIDWAPDWCISDIAKILIEKEIKSTWFVTHDSPAIRHLSEYPDLFELGIHPNFQNGSTQGNSPKEVMEYLLNIIPDASSVRTHGLVQSSHLLKMMAEEFNIKDDVSIFLPYTPNIQPHNCYISNDKYITRIPFFWEDDSAFLSLHNKFNFQESKYHTTGLKIYNFHPIHIYLNSNGYAMYEKCKSEYPCITDVPIKTVASFINQKRGVKNIFNDLLNYMTKENAKGYFISEISNQYNSIK
ncbi:MAG: hypothetical protein QCI00_04660 [Candidatus Thermoplasmatota archaeon]|nr:hypothetical protein [Candidatus Thermoplasmatota archaeon]